MVTYEKIKLANGDITELHYIAGGDGLAAIHVVNTPLSGGVGVGNVYYTYTDHLGSILTLTDNAGNRVFETNFDAWGRRRNIDDWSYDNTEPFVETDYDFSWLTRGYTGHEHLPPLSGGVGVGSSLINMNGRLYDPILGRMLSPDNYVQSPEFSQSYNRYSYVVNNPIKYTDASGEWFEKFFNRLFGNNDITRSYANDAGVTPVMEATLYSHYQVAIQTQMILAGVATGGLFYGLTIPFSSTLSIMGGSLASSTMQYGFSQGNSDIILAFGFGSYNFSNGNFGYFGKSGNSALENIGYGLGALANISDLLAGFNPGSVELRTENDPNYYKTVDANGSPIPQKDLIGHSQITDVNGKPLVDWGPTQGVDGFGDWVPGTNSYEQGLAISSSKMKWSPLTIDGVNTSRISSWKPAGNYNLAFNSCVSQTSRALNASGAFNIGVHPYLLHGQMYLRSIGVRPMLYSYYLTR